MHSETKGKLSLGLYFPPKRSPAPDWSIERAPDLKIPLKQHSEEKQHPHQAEKTTSGVHSYIKMPDQTHMIIYSVLLISWTFAYKSIFLIMNNNPIQFKKSIQFSDLWSLTYIQYFWFTLVDFLSPRL